ncbi:MAG: transcription-repair coupling factor [Gammaproteobacteria bacterium]|jgi:transcription-repair coupling factor (superfamily II helicase)|nr:transcription-repair coupling factor [Gammaproteobacteria bacterium]MBT4462114.1 transcription-repair coupling factor [Gammaproteobacteria bacterium]MBT4654973.1 transcription-repair coupling factor [Gammaproteobacteria bacterium]MBT5116513.1 transcription-repair coupling factor [Gammaproteobacteria bacterium]MBT5761542.1 transcription-repair coupling factor [Gammaproteobacteria bacterium]
MKNIFKDNKNNYVYGGLYGSSGSYIIEKISHNFNNTIILLNNNNEIINFSDELKLFLNSEKNISLFLEYESFPYEDLMYDVNVLSERLKSYKNILSSENNIIITSYSAIAKYLVPKNILSKYFTQISKDFEYNNFITLLRNMKYDRTEKVVNKGEYAIRGAIIDVYSTVENYPIRLNFDGDMLETLKMFNVDTQVSKNTIKDFFLGPANEVIITDDVIKTYKSKCKDVFDDEYLEDVEYEKIINNLPHSSAINIIPVLYDNLTTIFNLIPNTEKNIVLSMKNTGDELKLIRNRYRDYYAKYKDQRYILNYQLLIINDDIYKASISNMMKCVLSLYKVETGMLANNSPIRKLPSLLINNAFKDPYKSLKDYIYKNNNKIVFAIERNSLILEIQKLLENLKLKYHIVDSFTDIENTNIIYIIKKYIDDGFVDYENNISFISAKDIFGARSLAIPKKSKNKLVDNYINDISSLELDSPVVHDNYGVGRYKGLINMDVEGIKTELIKLEYSNEDILYIPVTSINLLKKYSGHTGLNIPLHNLGTDYWIKIRNRAKKKINDIAVDLLEIESKRLSSKGFAFKNNIIEYQKFSDAFPYQETEDQIKSINNVIDDMESEKPMDRLICGDVGYGKTEVIMRAAFLSAINNCQTIVLAPTTILVEQHYKSFINRFSSTAINIGKISRLQSAKDKKETLLKLKNGEIDIIIGTHAILSKKIEFNNLKLLVVDEEHKFGVTDKEKIKKLKNNIDIITLTATPIPRTLNSALSQIKDLSVMETPPQNRKSIVTRIIKWEKDIINEAIEREIQRGGQIYYVHNEISTMDIEIERLLLLNQDIKVGKIHGQLDPKYIEIEMQKFLNKEYDLLVCTSIIESGLDIQNVNTIIINNSNKFGLSQLHQIRGRVGRTNRQAYAYLVIPEEHKMTKDAEKRLLAIDSVESLGGGLELATHDLEIRGAGEILGEEQSGQIYEIGYAMFTDILNKSIEFLRTGDNKEDIDSIEIEINKSCLITQDYINDILTRLKYYKKISSCKNLNEITYISDELIDIYGPMPEFLENLLHISKLKLTLKDKNIKHIKIVDGIAKIEFKDKDNISVEKIIANMSQYEMKILKNSSIQLSLDNEDTADICQKIENLIKSIF